LEKAFPVLETDRLILREATEEDANDMYVYLSDQLVVKHMGISACETPEEVLGEIEWYKSIYRNGTGIRWGITLKDSGKVIGSCGFLNRNSKHYRSEVGYELSREHWGKGIANEALERVLEFGFEQLGLERIEALIEPKNLSSQKLVERQGFTREGLLRHYEYTNGKFDDLYMYSILKGDL
jgi:[ribosomal protein S5]-alanine N-acetyltransferase